MKVSGKIYEENEDEDIENNIVINSDTSSRILRNSSLRESIANSRTDKVLYKNANQRETESFDRIFADSRFRNQIEVEKQNVIIPVNYFVNQ